MGPASKKVIMVVLAATLVLAMVAETGHGMKICHVDVDKLKTCLPAVKEPNPTPPSPECCKTLGEADLSCLCSYKDSPIFGSLGIDIKLCLQLPAKCGLAAPPCSA